MRSAIEEGSMVFVVTCYLIVYDESDVMFPLCDDDKNLASINTDQRFKDPAMYLT